MDLDGQIKLGHLLLQDRKCRSCGEMKNLINDKNFDGIEKDLRKESERLQKKYK